MGGPDEYILIDELAAVAKVHTLAAFDFLGTEAGARSGRIHDRAI
jgi:hypothetical protein